jgi:3-phosphoshikimate 1-carboxyvinyltransferase
MLNIQYNNKKLAGTYHLPASKSISNRLLIMRAMGRSKVLFDNLSEAEDTYMMRLYLSFINTCAGSEIPLSLDAHNAGTVFRFLLAYLANQEGRWLLTGEERMRQRPVGALVDALRSLGADVEYTEKENFPPLLIRGKKLKGGEVHLNASASSQYVSALMLIAPYLPGGLTIRLETEPVSSAYIDMTAVLMRDFGAQVSVYPKEIRVEEGTYQVEKVSVESDWSAAAFWYEMVAFLPDSSVFLPGLTDESVQGDRFLIPVFDKLGVRSDFQNDGLLLTHHGKKAASIDFDFRSAPDIVPSVMVACAALGVEGKFSGIEHLRIKESDRIGSMQQELGKIGTEILKAGETYRLIPGKKDKVSGHLVFNSHGDHRMAMSLAPLAIPLGMVTIKNPEVVKKSYPDYWDELEKSALFSMKNLND